MAESVMAKIIESVFRISGRQRRYSNAKKFEKHLDKMRVENSKPFNPSWAKKFSCPVERTSVDGNDYFVINKGKGSAIMYLHGGSCIHHPLYFHYRFLDKLASKADVTIYFLLYPLAPVHTFEDTYKMMSSVYDIILQSFPPEKITIMGDSIGGNLALGFPQSLLGTDRPQPASVILLSPWLDMTGEHPETTEYYKREPRLALNELKRCGEIWSNGVDRHDPMLSPIFGEIKGLGKISVYVGTHELLLLDSRRLRDRAKEEKVEINYHEYEGLTHVFPLQPIPEAKKSFDEILGEIAR